MEAKYVPVIVVVVAVVLGVILSIVSPTRIEAQLEVRGYRRDGYTLVHIYSKGLGVYVSAIQVGDANYSVFELQVYGATDAKPEGIYAGTMNSIIVKVPVEAGPRTPIKVYTDKGVWVGEIVG